MEEATVAFKVDFSDENIKRKVMEAVSNFPGVTLVDIKEEGKLMVRGKFEEMIELGLELRKIDKSIVVDSKVNAKQNMQVSIIKVLDIRKANRVIWEFSGVTSVESNRFDQLEVKGEFDILEMVEKLKEIDIYVSVLKPKQFDAGSSSGPKIPEQSEYSMPAAQPPNKGAWSIPPLPQFTLNKGAWSLPPLPQFKQLGQGGGLLAGFGIKKQQPPFKHPRQDYAEKLRNDEKAKAEEKARTDKQKAEDNARIDKAKAGGNMTGMQTAGTWLRTQVTGAIGSTLGTANTAHSQQTERFGFTKPTSTANPYPTQQTRATNKHPKIIG